MLKMKLLPLHSRKKSKGWCTLLVYMKQKEQTPGDRYYWFISGPEGEEILLTLTYWCYCFLNLYFFVCKCTRGMALVAWSTPLSKRITAVCFDKEKQELGTLKVVVCSCAHACGCVWASCSKENSIDNASLLGGKQPGPFTWLSFGLWCQNASLCLQFGIYKHSSTLFPGVSAPGSLLKGFCCWSCSLLIMHTVSLPLTGASVLSLGDCCPPATAEVISPQEIVKKIKGCISKVVRLWGLRKPNLIYIRASLESFPTDRFGMLSDIFITLFIHYVAISES